MQGSPFHTYDQEWARVHALPDGLTPVVNEAGAPTPPRPAPTALTLADLRQLVRQPVEVFFRARLQVQLDAVAELEQIEEPFSLKGLQNYQAGQTLLEASDPQAALTDLGLSGQLPMAAFGTHALRQLQTQAQVVLERKAAWTLRYPHALPAQSIELNVDGMALTGTLEGLWHNESAGSESAWLQINQRVGAVLEGEKDAPTARGHVVVGLWVHHLVACASGFCLTSVQLGLDGQVVFLPLAPADALASLQLLVKAYRAAWERPLPVACKTAWVFLQTQAQAEKALADPSDKAPPDPHEAAQTAFDGGHYPGERSESAYLARAFESYEDLEDELSEWAALLYGDMATRAQTGAKAVAVPT